MKFRSIEMKKRGKGKHREQLKKKHTLNLNSKTPY